MSNTPDLALSPPHSRHVEVDGVRCHYLDQGSGPAILALHPAPGWSCFYERLIDRLEGRFRLVVPDFPGFGLSADPEEFSLPAMRRFVTRFMDEIGLDSAMLLVNDASGAVGLGAAADAPERFSALIITDTFAFPLRGRLLPAWFMLRFVMPVAHYPNRWFNLLPLAVTTLGCALNPLSREQRRKYLSAFHTPRRRDCVIRWFRELGRSGEYLRQLEESIRSKLREHPTLLIYGQFDPMRILGAHRRFMRLLPNNDLRLITWEEHFPVLGSAGRVARAIDSWYGERHDSQEN